MQTQTSFWLKTLTVAGVAFCAIYFYNQEPEPVTTENTATQTTTKPPAENNNIEKEIATISGNNSSVTASAQAIDSRSASPELHARIKDIRQRRPGLNYSAEEISAAVERSTSWSPAEKTPTDLPLEPEELTDGRQFIQLDTVKMETLMPGDKMNVRVAENGTDYDVVIDKVEKHDYNSISWHGHIQGQDGEKYSVSFTRGESLTVGGLDTPDGHYVLQAHDQSGWIASSELLFKADPNFNDAIDPGTDAPNTNTPHQH